jgi:hypothetical protein
VAQRSVSVMSELTQQSGSLKRLASDLGRTCHKYHRTVHKYLAAYDTQNCQKSDPAPAVLWCKGALIYLRTLLKGEKTLYICPKWRWEAIKGGNQPQPLHHGIISTRLSPRIAKI